MQGLKRFGEQISLNTNHIADHYDYSGDMSGLDADALHDYNATIKRAICIREKERKRSLETLPDEILIAIIQEAAVTWPGTPPRPQRLFLFTLISRRWANLILHTPLLWTTINLRLNIEDLEATTAVQLELSRDCSLELIYHVDSILIHRVAHLLQPHIHRVTRLYLLRDVRDSASTDPFFPHAVFTSLQKFKVWGVPSKRIVDFLSHQEAFAPYAHPKVNPIHSFFLNFRGNHLVSTSLPASSVAPIRRAEDIRTLKEVDIYRLYSSPPKDWPTDTEHRRTPLSWEELRSRGLPWPVMHGLISRCTSLVSLALDIGWNDTQALVKVVSRLRALQRIVIRILHSGQPKPVQSSSKDNHERTGIRNLEVITDSSFRRVNLMIDDILYPLLHMSPRLESFKLSGYRGKKLDFTEFEKLGQLRRLYLNSCRYIGAPNETRTRQILASPSLELVDVTGSRGLLDSLGSLTACRLVYQLPHGTTQPSQDYTIQVCGKDWPALRELRLDATAISARVNPSISAMTLLRLELSSRLMVTTMIRHLATHPSELPVLNTLDLWSCPEWDILFIMLEKRLLVQTTKVTPIERIIFHRVIPAKLKQALALLLTGHIVSRPSNYDLSMLGNLDILLDLDIPGCVDCHLYLHPCDLPTKSAPLNLPELTITYPTTADEILRTQSIRYVQTESIYIPTSGWENQHRYSDCRRLDETVEVSRYSIDS